METEATMYMIYALIGALLMAFVAIVFQADIQSALLALISGGGYGT